MVTVYTLDALHIESEGDRHIFRPSRFVATDDFAAEK
jgi:hypothetical protein